MVAAQVALGFTALMAVLALLVDGGLVYAERRHAQATADAAALAAASDLYANWNTNVGTDPNGTAKTSALNVAYSNGYTNDGTTSAVTINISPANYSGGPHAGTALPAGYAEATVTWYQPRGLSAIWGTATIPISARAVARGVAASGTGTTSGPPGILLLKPSGTALSGRGKAKVDVADPSDYTGTSASVSVNSTGPNAVAMTGSGRVSAPSIFVAQSGGSTSGLTASAGGVNTGATPFADPLSYLPVPSTSNPPSGINVVSLPNGITDSMPLDSNTIYIVGGPGILLSGGATLTGTNVMVYVTGPSAAISLTGTGTVSLTPMTTGPYAGVVLFQDRSDTNGGTLDGSGNLSITGTIYAPAAGLSLRAALGDTTDVFGSQIIASTLTLSGRGTVNVDYNAPMREVGLVE
jgi:hypothetical protein